MPRALTQHKFSNLFKGTIIMTNSNDFDYYDIDNFDDNYGNIEYQRHRPKRHQDDYDRHSPLSSHSLYSRNTHRTHSIQEPYMRTSHNKHKSFNMKRFKNRLIIISGGVLILILIILIFSAILSSCGSNSDDKSNISTDTVLKQKATASTTVPTVAADTNAEGDLSPTYFKTPQIKDDNSNGVMYYNIYVWDKIGFELFGSTDEKAQTYADTISSFADKMPDITVYDMVIPNHTEFGLPQRLKSSDAPSTSQADNLKAVYAKLSDKVKPINPYNYLADHNSEYTYFSSDHHWTGLGAYYAYKAFADTNKQPALMLDKCTEKTIEGFTGTFSNTAGGLDVDTVHYWELPYSVTMDITSEDGTVTTYDSPYYKDAAAGALTYGVFILGDNPLTVLKSSSENAENAKKIAVIKESYGNAFVPYLTYNYGEVHVIDFRSFINVQTDLYSYCKQNGIDEVLFINGVMSANTQIQLDSMCGLFN